MFETVLPRSIDNVFRGNRLALWAFYPITAVTVARSFVHIFREDGGAQSIGVPPGAYLNIVLIVVAIVGLALSLRAARGGASD